METQANKIGKLTPSTNTFEEWPIPTVDSFPTEATGSEGGYLYFAESRRLTSMGNTSAYVKIVSLAGLIGILYLRDFVVLLQPVLSFERTAALMEMLFRGDFIELLQVIWAFEWMDLVGLLQVISIERIVFTLTIGSLIFLSLFQRKKALKTLMVISENDIKQGAVFLSLAIGLYVVGSYTPFALWLHWYSLILFIVAYLMLRLDFRIPRALFVPFVALLLVAHSPIEDGLIVKWSAFSLIAFAVVAFFLADALDALIFRRAKGVKPCPLCQSEKIWEETFCPHCGRQRLPPKPASTRFAITKLFILLLIVSVLTFVYIPVLSLTDQQAAIMVYTPGGVKDEALLQTPQGWVLETSVRLTDYEREHLEDLVILNTYAYPTLERYAEERLCVLLEISSRMPYMRGGWRMPEWQRMLEGQLVLNGDITGLYVVLQKQNKVMTVLYWTIGLLFKTDMVYSTRYVGVSIILNFTEPISELQALEVLTELRSTGVSMVERWSFINRWTLHASTLSEIYARFKDIFFTIIGVVGVFLFAGWARAKDERAERLAENALFLSEYEATLLAGISSIKKKGSTGATLFEAYKRLTMTEEDINQFYEKLKKLLRFNLLKRNYVLRNSELIMIWERKFP